MRATQAEQDKEVAKLYLARSEGKVIQVKRIITRGVCQWDDLTKGDFTLSYGCRIKPQTAEDAAGRWIQTPDEDNWQSSHISVKLTKAFIAGTEWQKEQDNG